VRLEWIWNSLANAYPENIYPKTMQMWLNSSHAATERDVKVTNDLLLAESPLVFFRVDMRIFRSPLHLRCLMRMLGYYLESGRLADQARLNVAIATGKVTGAEREEKFNAFGAYCDTQMLTTVQLLLETCDANSVGEDAEVLDEIRTIACERIHQMFVYCPYLAKLVHYVTYPNRLIPVMVKYVPSAHILIEQLAELVIDMDFQKRALAIDLVAALIEKYKIPAAFACVRLVSDMLDTLLGTDINETQLVLFIRTVLSLARLIKESPFHAPLLLNTIDRVRKIALSRISLYTSMLAAKNSLEAELIGMIDKCKEDCKSEMKVR